MDVKLFQNLRQNLYNSRANITIYGNITIHNGKLKIVQIEDLMDNNAPALFPQS